MDAKPLILSFVVATALTFATTEILARGGGASSGGSKSVFVHGYYRSDGTHVDSYYRSAPGSTGLNSPSGYSGGYTGDVEMKPIPAVSTSIYKCSGPDGVPIFQQQPCPGGK